MPGVPGSLGHKGVAFQWGLGQLLPGEHGGCASAPSGQTTAQAGRGCPAARKKKLLQAWYIFPREGNRHHLLGGGSTSWAGSSIGWVGSTTG